MDNTEKMAALLSRLRKEMNGAVTDAMKERGIDYPLNYGVSVPTLRDIARAWAPDHSLARLLYRQQVRELILSATVIADPGAIGAEELEFWAAGVRNSEIAEHLSMLMARTRLTGVILERWMNRDTPLPAYAALLTAARSGDFTLDSGLANRILTLLDGAEEYLCRSAARFIERAAADENAAGARRLFEALRSSQSPRHLLVAEECAWLFAGDYEA